MEIHFPKHITPIEQWLLSAVATCLSDDSQNRLIQQVEQINKVQRLDGWKEIDYFHTRFLGQVAWDPNSLFDNRGDFCLGEFIYHVDGDCVTSKVWAANGHIFSIESDTPLKPYARTSDIELIAVDIDLSLTVRKSAS